MEKKKLNGDLVLRIGLIIFCVTYYWIADSYKPSAKLMPQLIAILTLALTLLTFILPWVKEKMSKRKASATEPADATQAAEAAAAPETAADETAPKRKFLPNVPNWILLYVITFLYFALFKTVGFIITTFAVVVSTMYLFGHKNKITIWVFSALFTAVIYICFKKLFYVSLPAGILRFLNL